MEYVLYQRPREKLRSKGAGALRLVELLQVIVGSGTSKVSVAKIARSIEGLMDKHTVAYADLLTIKGVGEAKACQILAALELSKRYATRHE